MADIKDQIAPLNPITPNPAIDYVPPSVDDVNKLIADALTKDKQANTYSVSLIPYHTHNNTDSPNFPFTNLNDVPNTYAGASGQTVKVNNTNNGLVFSASLPDPVTVPHGGTGVITLAAHGVLVGEGTSNVVVTGTGTTGQVLTSNGASSDPTFQAVPPLVPAWVDEGTLTWSSTSTAQTFDIVNTGKTIYMVIFTCDFPGGSVGNALRMQLNGDTGTNYNYVLQTQATFAATTSGVANFIQIGNVGANATYTVAGILYIQGIVGSSGEIGVKGEILPAFVAGNGGASSELVSANWGASGNLSSFTLFFNGKTTTGKAHIYSLTI